MILGEMANFHKVNLPKTSTFWSFFVDVLGKLTFRRLTISNIITVIYKKHSKFLNNRDSSASLPASLPACQPAILPYCILPKCQPASLPACHTAILHTAKVPACQPAILPYCQPVILPACQPARHHASK
jgi:hypothetical protein